MIENLKLERVVVHEVLTAAEAVTRGPNHAEALVDMSKQGQDLICQRLSDAVGSVSHCEEMIAANNDEDSPFQKVAALLSEKSDLFVTKTASLADRLTEVQVAGSVKPGIGVFLQGTGVHDGKKVRWLSIIKADPDRALMTDTSGPHITLSYVANLIMGAQQRLLKVAFFVELTAKPAGSKLHEPSDFLIKIYDHLLSNTGRGSSAIYFYSSFLGLKPADNSAKLCRVFYETTREFTDDISKDDAEKALFRGHLVSYLRSEKRQISVKDFAESYLQDRFHDAYKRKMRSVKFPSHAVARDIALIKSKLKRHAFKFTSKIVVTGSAEDFESSVQFGDLVVKNGEEWTELAIKGKLE